ncbi:hypothetical protein LAA29_180159 [Leuconostoc carnosum]|nr:hypothetical protein [Leuconostoc carnosum]WLC97773.1 hypothetical protein Q5R05_09035 [Leuconostoc carnosum]SPJ43687.1 hypothetical protein LCAC16_270157 [Leuconostoc carnosum]SPO33956.1 hypothetical protein LAA29_180159 [Leuconostoc carnosum]
MNQFGLAILVVMINLNYIHDELTDYSKPKALLNRLNIRYQY